ncbi:MAG: archaemetzincin family Zn-dependent metalloprotease [Gemmatimonadota bacterium]
MDENEGIRIIPIGEDAPSVAGVLTEPLEARFGRPVRVEPVRWPRGDWYDAERGQFRADRILDHLTEAPSGPGAWSLAILDADLYAPGLSFVFGQATVGGCCAVIGLARLRTRTEEGDESDQVLFRRRVLTEAVHELGHVAGLGHCALPCCVMFFSNSIAETDRKGPDFCGRCRPGVLGRAA